MKETLAVQNALPSETSTFAKSATNAVYMYMLACSFRAFCMQSLRIV